MKISEQDDDLEPDALEVDELVDSHEVTQVDLATRFVPCVHPSLLLREKLPEFVVRDHFHGVPRHQGIRIHSHRMGNPGC